MNIVVISNTQTRDTTMSGADRIFIECVKRWTDKREKILVITCEDGLRICTKYQLDNVDFIVFPSSRYEALGTYLLYIVRVIKGCILALKSHHLKTGDIIVYSASDFWPDSIPAWVIKKMNKHAKWVAGFYLFASIPFSKGSPHKGRRFVKGLLYYLSQMPVYWLVRKYADMVWVTNELDRRNFTHGKYGLRCDRVISVQGGVDVKKLLEVPNTQEKKYDAIFIGRLVPEKGILQLVDIWKHVCKMKGDATLVILGSGELKEEVKRKIEKNRLERNIELLGFVDGVEKIKLIKRSRIVVHPSIFDSGGMSACEAMACGLPGVSFDLPALRVYYPKGIIKVRRYDLRAFAEAVIRLLDNHELYNVMSNEALTFARGWDWDKRADYLLKTMLGLLSRKVI